MSLKHEMRGVDRGLFLSLFLFSDLSDLLDSFDLLLVFFIVLRGWVGLYGEVSPFY